MASAKFLFEQHLFLEREMRIDSQTVLLVGIDPGLFAPCIIFLDKVNGSVKLSQAELEVVVAEMQLYLANGEYGDTDASGVHFKRVGSTSDHHSLRQGDNVVILNHEAVEEIFF